MKQQLQKLMAALTLLLLCIPLQMHAQSTREVLQPQFGKQTITVASDEVITFKDPKGDTNYSGTTSENAHSLTVFQPAEAGMSIQITFESMNMGGANNYYSFANVYSGNPDADNAFTWATTTSEVATSYSASILPTGNILRAYPNERNKTYTDETYVSASEDGIVSVGFAYRYAYSCSGWVATVKAVKLENMTVTGAGSNYDGVVALPQKKQDVALANAYVTAEGVMNPDNVTGVHFTMTKNEDAMDATALKLFNGNTQVDATVTADGDGYKFTLDEALSDGTNTFTIKGDFLGTAAIGAKVKVDITKITTTAIPDGITPFTAGTSVEVENPAVVLMTATPQTVTVYETPLQFFDEGGVDGGIVSRTNGQITFLSGVSGKKVMVDFTKNEIWHGSYYNQELRIYNGTEVNAANLIKTLQQGETGVVRSTADDGSLTVVLYSDASNDVAANGWEATVSLFEPTAMDFNGSPESSAASTETVCAGDTDQDMLTINVKAQNTEPAMQVTKMAFNAGENYALATKASLYFGNTKVGETDITAADFTITLNAAQSLVDGDNIFTLKYDISDEAVNDQKVSATLVSVTALVNGAEKTETATAAAVERTVMNIIRNYKDQGTVTKYVNGSVAFETKPTSEYSTKYEYGDDTRTNIFIPKHDGMVCQIDFSEFAVYYASSSYSTRAKFIIYNGQGTTGEKLWELNDNAQQNVGPGTIIRSTAADGALTVVFSPNTSYSSYTLNGWKATVSEYELKAMEVKTVEVTQASTADVSIGASDQELLNVNVKTEGALNPIAMSGIKLNLKGTEANIAKVSVWQDDTKLGETNAAAEVEVTFGEAVTLAEGNNQFVVKVDINADAAEDATIDAKVVSVTAGEVIAVTDGDPEGARTLKNQVVMTDGNHGIMYLNLGQTTNIYDDGGPEGNGGKVDNAVVTFAPTGEADCIKLSGVSFNINYVATITVYKGNEVNEDKKITSITGTSAKLAEPIISDASEDGGMLTVSYKYTGSSAVNFVMQAEGYKKSNVEVTDITVEDISVNEVLKGQTDVKMLKVAVEAKGELTPMNITAFDITTTGEAKSGQHIYQTGTASTFSPVTEFSEQYSIEKSGTYYFWVTYDINTEAAVGQTATAQLNSITGNGQTIAVSGDPVVASVTVASGKSGTYTVGREGADYYTIQGAVDDIAAMGMEGPVTLKIKAGEYNEKVRVPGIAGLGAVNTLTIESESGQRDVVIYHNNYTTSGYSDDQHKKDYGVFTLYEANYVTLKNLEIYTTDKTYKAIVMVKDESRHVTIDNCYLHAPICTASSGEDVNLVGHTIIDEENRNNDYLTVKNCLLEGGKMGINMGGTSYVALPKEVGGIIEGNTFKNNGQKAIYVMDELGVKIRNNVIIIESTANTKISVGILDMQLRDEYSESTEITGNIFNVAPKTYCAVMNLRQMEGTAEVPVIVANNVINLTSPNSSTSAFKFNAAKVKYVNVANNTFLMKGTNGGAAFWLSSKLDDGYGNINVINNIIQNETNGTAISIYDDANASKINFQNNVIYTAGSKFYLPGSQDYDYFLTVTGATGTVNKQATFLSDDVLEPANDLDGDLLTAQTLSYATTDLNGKARPATGATIGAYEYSATDEALVMNEGFPKATETTDESANINVNANGNGEAYILVLPASDAAPTAETVVAQGTSMNILTDKTGQHLADNLVKDQEYIAYVVLKSLRGTLSQVYPTAVFVASSAPVVPEPDQLVIETAGITTPLNQPATLTAIMNGGLAPYTVTWYDSKRNVVKTETLDALPTDVLTAEITPAECMDYVVKVTDARNVTAADTARVITTGDAVTATFESLYLDSESYWNAMREDRKNNYTSFVNGSYRFNIDNTYNGSAWSGFGYSDRTSAAFTALTHQWNSAPGGAYDGSDNFAVFYYYSSGSKTINVLNKADGDSIRGFYITNNAYAKSSMTNGDSFAKKFAQGDWFKLTVTADNGNTLDYYLADFRSTNEADHYILDTWEWLDLSSLGTVKTLTFSMSSSDVGDYGMNTPSYFCMDNFNGVRNERTIDTQTAENRELSLDMNTYKTLNVTGATTTYELVSDVPDGVTVTVNPDGTVTVNGTTDASFDIVIKVGQRGRSEYIRIPVVLGTPATGVDIVITEEGLADDGYYYATMYYGTMALEVPAGITAYTYRVDGGTLNVSQTYAEGETIPAGQGVVLQSSTADTFTFMPSNETGTTDAFSMLYGSDDTYQDTESGYTYYILTTPQKPTAGSLGFWWQVDQGVSVTNAPHKAYLKVPADNSSSIKGFTFTGGTTGITTIGNEQLTNDNGAWYTLDGKKLDSKPTQQGIYLHNGKKIVVR